MFVKAQVRPSCVGIRSRHWNRQISKSSELPQNEASQPDTRSFERYTRVDCKVKFCTQTVSLCSVWRYGKSSGVPCAALRG